MTPAERASAVAFAFQNCALEAMTPNAHSVEAARRYEQGAIDSSQLIQSVEDDPDHARADSVFAHTIALAERTWERTGDLAELQAIHGTLYDGIFHDAGKLRTEDSVRERERDTTQYAQAFFPAALIETGAANISSRLAEERNLHAMDRVDVTHELATLTDEFGYLHPFEGGNATVIRIFLSRLAHDAGWDLDWGRISRDDYENAKHSAYGGDLSGFEDLYERICRPANPSRIFLVAGWEQGPAH